MKSLKSIINVNKKKIVVISVVIFMLGGLLIYKTVPFTDEQKNSRINNAIAKYDYQKAYELNDKYFGKSINELDKNMYNVNMLSIELCESTNKGSIIDATNYVKQLEESKPKITKVKVVNRSYSSDYVDVNVTIQNNGTNSLNYVKINLYYMDKDGNTVKSEWTNDNSEILPNAMQTLTKMTEIDGWSQVRAEVDDWK